MTFGYAKFTLLPMKTQIEKLKKFYKLPNKKVAEKIGISERQLYYVLNGKNVGRFLREKINSMVEKIESL